MRSKLKFYCAFLCAVAAMTGPSTAGVIRHDRPDSQYKSLGNSYASVGDLLFTQSTGTFRGSGTLVKSNFVLTAAHNIDGNISKMTYKVGGSTYSADSWLTHSKWTGSLTNGYDVGLLHLSKSVTNVTAAKRYTGTSEKGKKATFVGFGTTGTGLTGYGSTSGTKRAGTNMFDVTGSTLGYSDRILLSDFDDPSNKDGRNGFGGISPLDLEYSIAPGDSGGGAFIDLGSGPLLAGVNSFIGSLKSPHGDGKVNGSYSDIFGTTRISAFNSWIDSAISNWSTMNTSRAVSSSSMYAASTLVPEPASVALIAFACLAIRRPRRI